MDALIQWVTQIIIFVLLATIIDLLMPSTSMKKYIKLIVGLILILILLKPVFYLFQIDIGSQLNRSFQQVIQQGNEGEDVESLIEFQKSEIETSQSAYILEQMAVQLTDLAEDPLLEDYQVEITDISFLFSQEDEISFEVLDEVIVSIREIEEDGEGAVSIVEDVVINTEEPAVTKDNEEEEKQIVSMLRDVWDLQEKELTIIWEGGAS
ncbi:stage III sporulation protein AF [Oceanobacillus picturae]|uniref:Stage III sporulation protein AF n=1 Tax=Oceanobacillus picturae TaxID=171693 RepID=W9AGV7_9BACI|nr:stage III sporulation protein AF [Oceanobacillus picturae]RIU96068.1 stage III sporulation protein AF [Oceanobacillus picturae]GAQ16386.1 stage III sporulation protein AF [Oceanobacillus picturae]CDO01926.1 stage III sporulation protein AF [Oceanobacillus picturae]